MVADGIAGVRDDRVPFRDAAGQFHGQAATVPDLHYTQHGTVILHGEQGPVLAVPEQRAGRRTQHLPAPQNEHCVHPVAIAETPPGLQR